MTDAKGLATLQAVRVLVDYRPALRERTGVGEYVHELVRAYGALPDAAGDRVRLFTSSWKDRPVPGLGAELRAEVVDRRVPVGALNYLWHRLEWPPIETLAGPADVVHGQHPLLIPARDAAQVITIHDLYFLRHPERTRAEIRRDYPALVHVHAARADAVITSSNYTAQLISRELRVPPERVHLCYPGAPVWTRDGLGRPDRPPRDGVVMFLGTLEPRKNVGALLEAYRILLARGHNVPMLRLVGKATPAATEWLAAIARPPLEGHVVHEGYVDAGRRETMFQTARLLVLPSFDEGFGLPVLEAMSAGVPVIVSNRGSLPEIVGDAAAIVEPDDHEGLAAAIVRYLDRDVGREAAQRGLRRAADFTWARTAAAARRAYVDAIARRRERG